ncbi:MAG: hypothetical protein M1838_000806 [Thelocarpon superellum]|nr:MAG: hypothetical protein M1838_000806 [Thelocarpon superellum]
MREILSTVDPTSIGEVPYESFVAVCALKMHARASSSGRQAEQARIEEVRAAYRLFTGGSEGPITMAHLRRVAAELKEDEVTDDQLKDMVAEANGGVGAARGVRFDDFEAVMRRAGVFT